ncbi:MAG: hypothetical protein IT328_20585 [Caldilineaceae bacterium]|nr:hypothetical protein [Caldilineaceae bacterium]
MEIPLFEADTPMRFDRIVLYPYPDLKRIWTRIWLPAVEGHAPHVEIAILNPDGSENCSVYMMARRDQRIETTLHVRDPQPGTIYRVVATLTTGLGDKAVELDRREFDLLLEFRNPEKREPGFGVGVDWNELGQGAP